MRAIRTRLIRTKKDVAGAWVLAVLLVGSLVLALAGFRLGVMGLLYIVSFVAGFSLAIFLTRPGGYRKLRAVSLVVVMFAGWWACGVVGLSADIRWLYDLTDIETLPGVSAFGFVMISFGRLFGMRAWDWEER